MVLGYSPTDDEESAFTITSTGDGDTSTDFDQLPDDGTAMRYADPTEHGDRTFQDGEEVDPNETRADRVRRLFDPNQSSTPAAERTLDYVVRSASPLGWIQYTVSGEDPYYIDPLTGEEDRGEIAEQAKQAADEGREAAENPGRAAVEQFIDTPAVGIAVVAIIGVALLWLLRPVFEAFAAVAE